MKKCKGDDVASYRDPDLSKRWLWEADWRADNDNSRKYKNQDAQRTIKRLTEEVRKLRGWT